MACYVADFEELAWLTHKDRDRVSPVSQIIFDKLREMKWL
jgi:8-oxo-dGTP diphosphatase